MTSTLRDPAVRSGLRLLGRTLLQYRRESMFSVASALLWMTVVVLTPYLTKLVIDRAIEGGLGSRGRGVKHETGDPRRLSGQ